MDIINHDFFVTITSTEALNQPQGIHAQILFCSTAPHSLQKVSASKIWSWVFGIDEGSITQLVCG